MARRFLVFVRAGEKSLHRGWLQNGGERTWDLVVSWYGDAPYEPVADERVLPQKGGKWNVIHDQLVAHPELLDGYEYFWFPDDDIEADAATIDRMFAITAEQGLALSQPALTPDSYFHFMHTVVAPSFLLRHTNIIEVMVPCLSRDVLRRFLPHLGRSRSGWGIDGVWTRLDADNRGRAAIIDAVQVRHTRPIGLFLAGRLRAQGIEPDQEGRALKQRFGHPRSIREFPCYGGIGRSGRPLGHFATWTRMLGDYLAGAGKWREPKGWKKLRRVFRFAYRPGALQQLHDREAKR